MTRLLLKAALIAGLVSFGAVSASAQFGSIFGDPPPRPPGSVPGGRQQMPTPPPSPAPSNLPPPGGGPYGGIQSQPLPPPPGAASADPGLRAPIAQPPLTGLPPGQRQPRGVPQPADTSPQPGDEIAAEPPSQKIPNSAALFSGLDKITGRIINFDEDIGETVQFGALRVKTDACYTRPATEAANTDAFVEVDEITLQGEVKRIFSGWMFAASPGLHGVEHPIYDIWLTDCTGPETTLVNAAPTEPPKPAAPPPPAQKRAPKQAQRPPPQPQFQPPPQEQPPPPPPQRQPGLFPFGR